MMPGAAIRVPLTELSLWAGVLTDRLQGQSAGSAAFNLRGMTDARMKVWCETCAKHAFVGPLRQHLCNNAVVVQAGCR